MGTPGPSVAVESEGLCVARAVPYRRGGRRYLTVVAKITMQLVDGGIAAIVRPEPLAIGEQADSSGFLRSAGELAPLLARAEVLVAGHARPTTRIDGLARLRLGYWRESEILVDKSQAVLESAQDAVWARGFGPIRACAPERARWLGGAPVPEQGHEMADLPAELDVRFFQAAPIDQQLAEIHCGDGLLLDQMVAGFDRLTTRLPPVALQAVLVGPGLRSGGHELRLAPDTLVVDLDRTLAHLVFRGGVALCAAPAAYRVRVSETHGHSAPSGHEAVVAPADDEPATEMDLAATLVRASPSPHRATTGKMRPGAASTASLARTASVDPAELERLRAARATPFDRDDSQRAAHRPSPPSPAAGARISAVGSTQTVSSHTPERPGGDAKRLASTAAVDPAELERLRAARPMPFKPTAPTLRAETPAVRERRATLGGTAAVDPAELERLRGAQATPFQRPSERPAVDESAILLAVPRPPLPAFPRKPTGSDVAISERADLGATASLNPSEIERLRALHATPFEALIAPAPPGPAKGTEGSTGYGAAFLRALMLVQSE